ncbi:MAG: regulatory protein RecX [Pseudomonadales bacterium]|nr:regulatory protein RecX [Pseudomonadales bacterium]
MGAHSATESPRVVLRRAAMDKLARREHSFHELALALRDKYPGFDLDEAILPTLERLREENLQSDARFVENFVRSRKNKGTGPLKISAELKQKGVSTTLIGALVDAPDNDWTLEARQVLLKKYRGPVPDTAAARQKAWFFLQQRGFRRDDIATAIHLSANQQ